MKLLCTVGIIVTTTYRKCMLHWMVSKLIEYSSITIMIILFKNLTIIIFYYL